MNVSDRSFFIMLSDFGHSIPYPARG